MEWKDYGANVHIIHFFQSGYEFFYNRGSCEWCLSFWFIAEKYWFYV